MKQSWSHKTCAALEKSISGRGKSVQYQNLNRKKPVQYQNLKGLLKDRLQGLTAEVSYSVDLAWAPKLHL